MDAPKDFTLDEDSYRDDIMGDDYGDDDNKAVKEATTVKKEVEAPKVQKTESSFKLESDRDGDEAGKAAAVATTEVVKAEEKKEKVKEQKKDYVDPDFDDDDFGDPPTNDIAPKVT